MSGQNIITNSRAETWKPCPSAPEDYSVSDFGRIKRVRASKGAVVGKILKCGLNAAGYRQVTIHSNGNAKCGRLVHWEVAAAFLEKQPERNQINHKNGDKSDNRVENLEWCTASENMLHSFRVLGNKGNANRGEQCSHARLTASQVEQIRRAWELARPGKRMSVARRFAAAYGVSVGAIRHVGYGTAWRASC